MNDDMQRRLALARHGVRTFAADVYHVVLDDAECDMALKTYGFILTSGMDPRDAMDIAAWYVAMNKVGLDHMTAFPACSRTEADRQAVLQLMRDLSARDV